MGPWPRSIMSFARELSVTLRKTRIALISSDVQISENPAHRGMMFSRRAISALLMPARCSLRISAALVAGRSRAAKAAFAILSGMGEPGEDTLPKDVVCE
jgi:hypothetical protein